MSDIRVKLTEEQGEFLRLIWPSDETVTFYWYESQWSNGEFYSVSGKVVMTEAEFPKNDES